jgi:hypothetical protein
MMKERKTSGSIQNLSITIIFEVLVLLGDHLLPHPYYDVSKNTFRVQKFMRYALTFEASCSMHWIDNFREINELDRV